MSISAHRNHAVRGTVLASIAWALSLALGATVAAMTDECNQDPVYPEDPIELGYSAGDCSLDGNGSLALIGEFGGADIDPESALENVGRALIYHYSSGAWSEVQQIQHSLPASDDLFGASVAVSGRFAIVAAPGRTLGTGAIFFFERDVLESADSQWSQFDEIANLGGEDDDGFGGSITQHETVAIDGSIAVVGAWKAEGATSTESGRVYVYVFDVGSGQWIYEATLKPPYPDDAQECGFGYSVEISGNRVIVGAPLYDAPGPTTPYLEAGAAYVFTRTGTGANGWTLEDRLLSDSSDPSYDHFGWSVSIDGNATPLSVRRARRLMRRSSATAAARMSGPHTRI